MKPATRLAQIILDTPNWESNPALVAEVEKLQSQIKQKEFEPPNDMTQKEMDELLLKFEKGVTLRELSEFYGMSVTSVKRVLREKGISSFTARYKLIKKGVVVYTGDLNQVAEYLGVSNHFIRKVRFLNEHYKGYKILKAGDEGYADY